MPNSIEREVARDKMMMDAVLKINDLEEAIKRLSSLIHSLEKEIKKRGK